MNAKRWIALLLAALFACMSLCCFTASADEAIDPKNFKAAGITGTFISPWLYNTFSDARMDKEFAAMKELGIDTLIMGDCASKDKGATSSWSLAYPSKLPDFGGSVCGNDAVTRIFDYCLKYDIQLYLGVGCDSDWWDLDLSDEKAGKWLKDVCNISAKVVKELYDMYMPKYSKVFGGFYWVYEIWNHGAWNFDTTREAYAQNLSAGFNIVIDAINKVDKTKPLLFSPFITYAYDEHGQLATKDNCAAFYTRLFELTNFRPYDVIAPMDNIGGGGGKIDKLDEWTRDTYYKAIKNSKDKLKLWSNCESFIQPADSAKGTWTTCTMDRFTQQIQITSKYCEKIISFSWNHYMSPYNTIDGFNRSFLYYLQNGELETTKPTLPTKVSTSLNGNYLVAKWTQSTDDYGVAQYRIEKMNIYNGDFTTFSSCLITRYDGKDVSLELKHSLADSTYNKNGYTVYRGYAVDCSGNHSDYFYIVVDSENPENGVDLKSTDGEKGYYTQEEFDALDLEKKDSDEQDEGGIDPLMLGIIIFVMVLAVAAVAVTLVIVKTKKKK